MSNLKIILWGTRRGGFVLLALAAISSNSCKNSTTPDPNPVADTIHLVSSVQNVAFHSDSTADSIRIWLSCGCKYSLITQGSGGDVSEFTIQSLIPDTAWTTPHYLSIAMRLPPPPPSQYHFAAWYAFSAVDHYGNTKYDTLRLTANS